MSLLAPWFLLGLAALFVPIVLHRFSHSEPEEHSFPSTRFLDATRPPVSRKRRLRYRTLFSLRSLFLLLLCLLFAAGSIVVDADGRQVVEGDLASKRFA